jgi:hypothetical protein
MTSTLKIAQLPQELQDLLQQHMPTYNANNVLVLGAADHMRFVFLDTGSGIGKPVPRCAINVPYAITDSLISTVRTVADRRPS